MQIKIFLNQYRIGLAPSFNERLKMGRAVQGSIIRDCCKIFVAICLLCPALNLYAAQSGHLPAKEKDPQPAKEAGARQGQQAVGKRKKGKNKERSVFIPSDKVSSDVPVSFPADI